MEPESFFHVALKVDDLDESLAFYRDHLGAEVIERRDAAEGEGPTAVSHVAMNVGDKRLYCFDQAPYEATGDVPELPTGVLHFGYVVDDIETAWMDLESVVTPIMEPAIFGSLKIAFFEDTNGIRVELIEFLESTDEPV